MRGAEFALILVDERPKDAIDVGPNGHTVGCPVIVPGGRHDRNRSQKHDTFQH
jgi:hypothetical protein